MKRNIVISLVSDQTIPNVLLLKNLPQQDLYFFVSTKKMEHQRRTHWIIQSCNISENKSVTIEVIEDSLIDITKKLSALSITNSDRLIVNLTGGTKMMSLAAYNFLKSNFSDVSFFYKSITQYEYFDVDKETHTQKITLQLSVPEYLKAYGIACKEKQPKHTFEYSESLFQNFINRRIDEFIIGSLRVHYRGTKKSLSIEEISNFTEETESDKGKRIENLNEFLTSINYPFAEKGKLNKKDIEYLTGGWFEEYVFHKLKLYYPKADIRIGVNLIKGEQSNDNDLDVALCFQDQLYVIECKTSLLIDGKYTQLLNEAVYKASAINKNFGLKVKSYLFTLYDFQSNLNSSIEKAKVLGIVLNDISTIVDESSFKNLIQNHAL